MTDFNLYVKADKSKNAVFVIADYFFRQGLITQDDISALESAIEIQDEAEEKIDIKLVFAERDELKEQVAALQEAQNVLQEQLVTTQSETRETDVLR